MQHATTNNLEAEALLNKDDRVLWIPPVRKTKYTEIAEDFFGRVVEDLVNLKEVSKTDLYLFPEDCELHNESLLNNMLEFRQVYVIEDDQNGPRESPPKIPASLPFKSLPSGRVPRNVHGVGVLYPKFFESQDIFQKMTRDHQFQNLTESNKPGKAYRTGIYMTPVNEDANGDVHFHILRCSSNLSGPTLDFRETDTEIVEALNRQADEIFHDQSKLNHVLAQIYHNTPGSEGKKATKAKIKAHADKTKDMPKGGIMAFCTFYDNMSHTEPMGDFDHGVRMRAGKLVSVLTRLRFRLKKTLSVVEKEGLTKEFDVLLSPGSVFFMPLSTNRLYTHETVTSNLDVEHLPTRLGYVVRCSETQAIHRNGTTFMKRKRENDLVPLQEPNKKGVAELKKLYALENIGSDVVDYSPFLFSLNRGDYQTPITYKESYKESNAFRLIRLSPNEGDAKGLFETLAQSAPFEKTGKGRLGAVLVKQDAEKGVPIVRTTTAYKNPAQTFQDCHHALVENIQQALGGENVDFNNALIEIYDDTYTKMGFHSDQALDLEENSMIAIFSCYKESQQAAFPSRKLVVESKEGTSAPFEILLENNSVVLFSTETNRKFRHKIVPTNPGITSGNQWLGVTFRVSKTFVRYEDGNSAIFAGTGRPLTLANDAQQQSFFQWRRQENMEVDFEYPNGSICYTISKSDLMMPVASTSNERKTLL